MIGLGSDNYTSEVLVVSYGLKGFVFVQRSYLNEPLHETTANSNSASVFCRSPKRPDDFLNHSLYDPVSPQGVFHNNKEFADWLSPNISNAKILATGYTEDIN